MGKVVLLFVGLIWGLLGLSQNVGINDNGIMPDNSAMLDVNAAGKGVLIPRMGVIDRDNIANPANGLMIYNTDCNRLNYFDCDTWREVRDLFDFPVLKHGQEIIEGDPNPVENSQGMVYSVPQIAGTVTYNWVVPGGASIVSGNGSPNITVDFTTPGGGYICVTAVNSCGNRMQACLYVEVCPTLAIQGGISGNPSPLINSTGEIYNITPVPNADSYVWTVPQGAILVAGQGTTTITVDYGPVAVTGDICVTPMGGCGAGLQNCLSVSCPVLTTPIANAGSHITTSDFDANWSPVVGATTYYLDVSDVAGFTNLIINNQNVGNVTTYHISGLNAATSYYYRVRAENNCGITSNSNTVSVATNNTFPCGDPQLGQVTFVYKGNSVTYGTVNGQNGTCWLDRNLGASQVANSSTDANAYGDLFQWGRLDDGHQDKNSGTTGTLSTTDNPGHGNFILTSVSPNDWRNPKNDNLWQGGQNDNNPCPVGWRVPTETELDNERASWISQDMAGAYNSPLKFTVAGFRNGAYGTWGDGGVNGFYRSSTVTGDNARSLIFGGSILYMGNSNRSSGYSVRCIGGNQGIGCVTPASSTSTAATNVSDTGFDVNWTASNGATDYYLDVADDAGFNHFIINGLSVGNVTTYNVSGLTCNTTYYYRVRAGSPCGTSANSNDIQATTLFSYPTPTANAASNITYTGFTANWTASNGATNYYLDVADDAGFTNLIINNQNVGNVTTYNANSLTCSVTYYYRVRADGACGTTANSNDITVNLLVIASPTANAASSITDAGFTANWTVANGATDYYLDVADDAGFTNLIVNNQNVGNVTTHNVSGLACNTTYYYRIRAANACHTTANSNAVQTVTLALPTPVALAAGNVTNNDFDAQWNAVVGATGYYLDVATDAGFSNLIVNNQSVGNMTTYHVSSLSCGTYYYYRVRAENGCGTSLNSNVTTTTTSPCIWNSCGDPITFNYKGASVTYGTVVSANNMCWLDRNLGASQVAVSSTDANAYGDLFQWGRGDDGHQNRNSGITGTRSVNDSPGHGNFILASVSPYDWRNPQNDNLWQGGQNDNNPCPVGWRVPTETELDNERASWISQNMAGAYNSPLKLTVAGFRYGSNGSLGNVGSIGYYWAGTVSGTYARGLYFLSSGAIMFDNSRAAGSSVRCLKD